MKTGANKMINTALEASSSEIIFSGGYGKITRKLLQPPAIQNKE
jgi:hypothetical protein